MANLAATLKEEIQRLARKEVRAQTGATKQAVSNYRREIAKLKRELQEQNKKIALLQKREQQRLAVAGIVEEEEPADQIRFSARSVRSQRGRLGFSAKDYAKLVGVSTLTVYNWEHGKSRPQKAQLLALASVRGIGKREALAKLAELEAAEKKGGRGRRGKGRGRRARQ